MSICHRCQQISLSYLLKSNYHYPIVNQLQTKYYQKIQFRCLKKQSIFSDFIENFKQEINKNKEMKENLKKFREEADKLEQSEALKKAREKYHSIESETLKGSDQIKKQLSTIQDKIKETMHEVGQSDLAKKSREMADDVARKMESTAETMAKQGEQIAQSNVFKTVSSGVKAVKDEIAESATVSGNMLYAPPTKLRKREDYILNRDDSKTIEPNTFEQTIVLHKDSRWSQSWQSFKDSNQFVNKLFDIKSKYDESDHVLVRATRTVSDKITSIFGGMFTTTELSKVLTEIARMDPSFNKEDFIKLCQLEFIPNILEALVRGDLEILKDWCYEAAFNVLATPIRQAQASNYRIESKVLDVSHVDLHTGQIMEQGPVLVITFTAQQIMAVRNMAGEVVEGSPDKILRIFYVWAFCRDQEVLEPKAAWRLIDLSASPVEQWL